MVDFADHISVIHISCKTLITGNKGMTAFLSTSEVAVFLSVDESTVKRWSDSGALACIKTKGRHRRFAFSEVLRFIQENDLQIPEVAGTIFRRPDLSAHISMGNFGPLLDELHAAASGGDVERALGIVRLGMASTRGLPALLSNVLLPAFERVRVAGGGTGNRLASKVLRSVLGRLPSDVHRAPHNGRTAVCAGYEGESSETEVDCIDLVLSAEGWRVLNLGADVPADEVTRAMADERGDLAVIWAGDVEDGWKFQNDVASALAPGARKQGAIIALVGADLRARFGRKLSADIVAGSVVELDAALRSVLANNV